MLAFGRKVGAITGQCLYVFRMVGMLAAVVGTSAMRRHSPFVDVAAAPIDG
jgi:hypothetical protein